MWNNLDKKFKSVPSLSLFKSNIKSGEKPRKIFINEERFINVMHSRLRMGCSPLKSHLCLIMHVIDDSTCECGALIESPRHYFLECPLYTGPRNLMIRSIEAVTDCNINTILFGKRELNYSENMEVTHT